MKKIASFILMLVCLVSGCSCDNEEEVNKTSIYASLVIGYDEKNSDEQIPVDPFGTKMSLVGYYESKVNGVKEQFNELVEKYHSLLDRNYYYKDEAGNIINNVKVINDSYGTGESIVVDQIVINALKEGIKYTKMSGGKFNIFSGSIVDVWDSRFSVNSGKYNVVDPTSLEINTAMSCVPKVNDIDSIFIIDDENNKITFNELDGCDGNVSITLGAIAKSYFIDELSSLDSFKEIGPVLYDAGTSSIILKGDNPIRDNGEWYITVRDALNSNIFFSKEAALMVIKGDASISTSGVDQKSYVNVNGVRRHHIINALTGYPEDYLLSVTVVGKSALVMDVVTTTIMTMSNMNEIKQYLTLLKDNGVEVSVLLQEEVKAVIADKSYLLENDSFIINNVIYSVEDSEIYSNGVKVADIENDTFVIDEREYKIGNTVKLSYNASMKEILDSIKDEEMIAEEFAYGA